MFVMDNHQLGKDEAALPTGFVFAEKGLGPAWDGNDIRNVANAWTTNGVPTAVFPSSSIATGAFDSGKAPGSILFELGFGTVSLRLPVQRAHVKMTISGDGKTATSGTVSGVIGTQDMIDAFAKVAGAISTDLCSGSTLDSIDQTIKQASDIMKDGSQNPDAECDGISVGVGFEAVSVIVGDVAPPETPPPNPCP
jgi:hypothetical protein